MKLGLLKTISKADLAKSGEDLPKWIDPFLGPLNAFIERVGIAMQRRLTFDDNFLCKVVALEFTHDTETLVNPAIDGGGALRVTGVLALSASGQGIDSFRWVQKDSGSLGVTFKFEGGTASTKAICRIIILLG